MSGNFPSLNEDEIEAAPEVSSGLLRAVLDQSPDCIKILSPEGRLTYMTYKGRCALDIDRFESVAGEMWWDLWPEEARSTVKQAVEQALQGEVARFTGYCPTFKGAPRWWEVSVSPIIDQGGQVGALLAISRDITLAKRDRDALEVMALEMRHRLRNAFAVSASFAKTLSRDRPETRAFADELALRLGALSVAQTKMLDADASVSVAVLIRGIADAFAARGDAISVGPLPTVEVGEKAGRLIAMVLGELGTNSLKHGALSGVGRVEIWGTAREGSGLVLHWRETAPAANTGLPQLAAVLSAGSGSGMELMRRMVAARGGSIEISMTDKGVDVTVQVP